MADDITTRPMLEALLEGQGHLASQMVGLIEGQRHLATQTVELIEGQRHLAAQTVELIAAQAVMSKRQDDLAAKQDALDASVVALTREVRDGFDEYNRRVDALNKRLLNFETWLSRIDDRLHDEIVARTR